MLNTVLKDWPEFLCTAAKIVTAVRHLEALGCLHTARAVIMWAWVFGTADVADQDGWKLIEGETLRFYHTYGIRSLASLKRCIISNVDEVPGCVRTHLFAARYEGPPFRVGRSRRPSKLSYWTGGIPYKGEWETDRIVSQACRLRRLYHLFGYDPTTWQEAVGVEEAGEERGVSLGRSVTPDLPIDWECDYL